MAKPTLLIHTADTNTNWSHTELKNLIKTNMLLNDIYYTTSDLTFFSFSKLAFFDDIILIDNQQQKYISAKELLENKEGYAHRQIVEAHNILKIFLAGGLEMLPIPNDRLYRYDEKVYKTNVYACFTGKEMNAQKMNFFNALCEKLYLPKKLIQVTDDSIRLNDGVISVQTFLHSEDRAESAYLGNTHVWVDSCVLYDKMSKCILIEPVVGVDTSKLLENIALLYDTWGELDSMIEYGDIEVIHNRTITSTNDTRFIWSEVQQTEKELKKLKENAEENAKEIQLKQEKLNQLYKKGYQIYQNFGGN